MIKHDKLSFSKKAPSRVTNKNDTPFVFKKKRSGRSHSKNDKAVIFNKNTPQETLYGSAIPLPCRPRQLTIANCFCNPIL